MATDGTRPLEGHQEEQGRNIDILIVLASLNLLRGNVLVDLCSVVRNAIRASVQSYSIKKLEQFCGFERSTQLRFPHFSWCWNSMTTAQ